jgi:ABC-type Na+ efflux pump permease subunit
MSAEGVQHRVFSFWRLLAITTNTLTDLTRQKVFYFVVIFALILIGSSAFMARFTFQQEFQILKDVSLGTMSIFTSVLAIVATARLISQDIEERTVYSILAKPVPRFEYLFGKLGGVLLLVFISTLLMSALFFAVLYVREQSALHEALRQMQTAPRDQLDDALRAVQASAFNINILPAVAIIYLKACLLAALTLLISTFATTNLFTIGVMVCIYFIGHFQAMAREYWLHEHSAGWMTQIFLAGVALFFPDLQGFNIVDDVVAGTIIPLALFARTAAMGIFYTIVYTLLATVAFSGKEL